MSQELIIFHQVKREFMGRTEFENHSKSFKAKRKIPIFCNIIQKKKFGVKIQMRLSNIVSRWHLMENNGGFVPYFMIQWKWQLKIFDILVKLNAYNKIHFRDVVDLQITLMQKN